MITHAVFSDPDSFPDIRDVLGSADTAVPAVFGICRVTPSEVRPGTITDALVPLVETVVRGAFARHALHSTPVTLDSLINGFITTGPEGLSALYELLDAGLVSEGAVPSASALRRLSASGREAQTNISGAMTHARSALKEYREVIRIRDVPPTPKRTSLTDPLIIEEVREAHITYGLTLLPGSKARAMGAPDWDRDLETDLAAIRAWAPDVLITSSADEDRHLYQFRNAIGVRPQDHLHQPSPMSGNLDEAWLLRGQLRNLHIRLTADASPKRVLIVSQRGLQRAGTLTGILLRLSGVRAEAVVERVNAARIYAISTGQQRKLIADTEPVALPFLSATLRKRDAEAPGVIEMKEAARKMMEASEMSRSAALERVAKVRGWRNWSTARAALSAPGLPYPEHDRKEAALFDGLGLADQNPDTATGILLDICHSTQPDRPDDVWKDRERAFVVAQVWALFALHAASGTQVGAHALLSCLNLNGDLGLAAMMRAFALGRIEGQAVEPLRIFAESTPGFSLEKAVAGLPQSGRTSEAIGFMMLPLRKPILSWEERITGSG